MEKKVVIVCIIVSVLGLLSAALGFAAEATKIKLSQVTVDSRNVCVYPGSPAFALGLTAATTLLMALVIINVASGCFCCYKRDSGGQSNRRCQCNVALVCFVFSWITFVPAFLELISASILNNQQIMQGIYYANNCYVIKSGVFAGSACLSFISVTLAVIYYLNFTSRKSGTTPTTDQTNGIAMGYPQVPPTTQQPAFVHEDTYMRRQFT